MHNNINNLFVHVQYFLYIGQGLSTDQHEHHALQLAIALDQPFFLKSAFTHEVKCNFAIIKPDIAHYCEASSSTILFLNIFPETQLARDILYTLPDQSVIYGDAEDQVYTYAQSIYNKVLNSNQEDVWETCNRLISLLTHKSIIFTTDKRVLNVLHFISENIENPFSLQQLSDVACLSEGRLTHLFKDEVGIPIRRYILWKRTCLALSFIESGEDFTNAAIAAGFSDSSHLTRTFNKVFGLPPSELFNNSQFIQASLHVAS